MKKEFEENKEKYIRDYLDRHLDFSNTSFYDFLVQHRNFVEEFSIKGEDCDV